MIVQELDQMCKTVLYPYPEVLADIILHYAYDIGELPASNYYASVVYTPGDADVSSLPLYWTFSWELCQKFAYFMQPYDRPPFCTEVDVVDVQPRPKFFNAWQSTACEAILQRLERPAYPSPWSERLRAGDVEVTLGGYIRRVPPSNGSETSAAAAAAPAVHDDVVIPGAVLVGATGVGKTRATGGIIKKSRQRLDDIINNDQRGGVRGVGVKAAAVIVPPQTFRKWEADIRRLWPDCHLVKVTNAESLKGLDFFAVTTADVVLVNFDVLLKTKTCQQMLQPSPPFGLAPAGGEEKGTVLLARTIFRLTVVDEVHKLYTNSGVVNNVRDSPKIFLTSEYLVVSKLAHVVKTFFYSQRFLGVTATPELPAKPSPSFNTACDSLLYLLDPRCRQSAMFPKTSLPELWRERLNENCWDLRTKINRTYVAVSGAVPGTLRATKSFLKDRIVVLTGELDNIPTVEHTVEYVESLYWQNVASDEVKRSVLYAYAPYMDFPLQCQSVVGKWQLKLLSIPARDRSDYQKCLLADYDLDQARINLDQGQEPSLGTILPPSRPEEERFIAVDDINRFRDSGRLPIVSASTAVVKAILDREPKAKVVLFTYVNYILPFVSDVLKSEGISVLTFNGSLNTLNKKRKHYDTGEPSVLIIPSSHCEGADFPEVTHIVNAGVCWGWEYTQLLGRAKRYGRTSTLHIVHVVPSSYSSSSSSASSSASSSSTLSEGL